MGMCQEFLLTATNQQEEKKKRTFIIRWEHAYPKMFKQQKECVNSQDGQGSTFKHITCCMQGGSSSNIRNIQQQQLHQMITSLLQTRSKALSKTSRCTDVHLTLTKASLKLLWYVWLKAVDFIIIKWCIIIKSNHFFIGARWEKNEILLRTAIILLMLRSALYGAAC